MVALTIEGWDTLLKHIERHDHWSRKLFCFVPYFHVVRLIAFTLSFFPNLLLKALVQ